MNQRNTVEEHVIQYYKYKCKTHPAYYLYLLLASNKPLSPFNAPWMKWLDDLDTCQHRHTLLESSTRLGARQNSINKALVAKTTTNLHNRGSQQIPAVKRLFLLEWTKVTWDSSTCQLCSGRVQVTSDWLDYEQPSPSRSLARGAKWTSAGGNRTSGLSVAVNVERRLQLVGSKQAAASSTEARLCRLPTAGDVKGVKQGLTLPKRKPDTQSILLHTQVSCGNVLPFFILVIFLYCTLNYYLLVRVFLWCLYVCIMGLIKDHPILNLVTPVHTHIEWTSQSNRRHLMFLWKIW